MMHSKLSYRAEIDGLRAIAVVSVILYHAQIELFGRNFFTGGFIGVDIFFVISGYLIARIVLSELQSKGSFSFLNFYERRARRILPILFFVILVSMPFAWQKLLPSDFVEYAESILASLFFGSNFFFYFNTTEYGADSALLKPFLHTWSLGVEEQFYLVFPILVIVAYKYFRKHLLEIFVGLALLSLQFSESMEAHNADLNFYLPFSRFWEFAVGSMLAYREVYYKPSHESLATKALPLVGLYLIVYSILLFDGQTSHPSFHTLVPIIGVALIIAFASKDELVGKVLRSTPFVWIGLISYSAYLWHFPIFAISRQISLSHSNYDKFEWIVATIILSIFSFFFVERPFRDSSRVGKRMFCILVISALVIASTLSILIINRVIVNSEKVFVAEMLDNGSFREEHTRFELSYNYSVLNNEKPNILIVGNSHAEDLLKALSFSYLANEYNLNLTSPLRKLDDINYQVRCFSDFLKNNQTKCHEIEFGPNLLEQYSSSDVVVFASRLNHDDYAPDVDTLSSSIRSLLDDGKKVIVVGNTPESTTFGVKKLNRFDRFVFENKRLPTTAELKEIEERFFNDFVDIQSNLNQKLLMIVQSFSDSNVVYKDRSEFMCNNDEKRCYMYFPRDRAKVLWDYGHTTTDGSRVLGRLITEKQWLSDFLQ